MSPQDNYAAIVASNLEKLYADLPFDLEARLSAKQEGDRFTFEAFGQACCIAPSGITLNDAPPPSVVGILITLYALTAQNRPAQVEPLKSFKELPNSMPYHGAFATHCERLLIPAVPRIKAAQSKIQSALKGEAAPASVSGDFAFVLFPLPKIALGYIFYEADEEFPPSVTCLISNNALDFIPIDGLADVGEYTSRRILEIIG